jgi:hypothetical protein
MTKHRPFDSSRRHFIQSAAALSAAGLWVPRAFAGPAAGGYSAGNYAIELGGSVRGWLGGVEIAEHLAVGGKDAVYGLGPFSASHSISESGVLLDWIMALPRKQVVEQNGAVILADYNFDAKRRIDFTAGHITSVKLPKLSAAEGKKPFAVDFKWQPSTVSHSQASGKVSIKSEKGKGGGAKQLSSSAFRFQGLPGDTDYITGITLPTISIPSATGRKKGEKPAATTSDVVIEVSGRSRESLYKYVHGVISDGKLTDNEYLDFGIELLDPTLTKTLATVQLFGCGLRSYKEAGLEANKEGAAKFTLTFSVERFDLKLSGKG